MKKKRKKRTNPAAPADELERLMKKVGPLIVSEHWADAGGPLETFIWYADGDECAKVHGNTGMCIDAKEMADALAKLPELIRLARIGLAATCPRCGSKLKRRENEHPLTPGIQE